MYRDCEVGDLNNKTSTALVSQGVRKVDYDVGAKRDGCDRRNMRIILLIISSHIIYDNPLISYEVFRQDVDNTQSTDVYRIYVFFVFIQT